MSWFSRKLVLRGLWLLAISIGAYGGWYYFQAQEHRIQEELLGAILKLDPEKLSALEQKFRNQSRRVDEIHLIAAARAILEKDFVKCQYELGAVNAQGSSRAAVLYLTGTALYQSDEIGEALMAYTALSIERPDLPEGHEMTANSLRSLGAMSLAIPHYLQVAQLRPDDYYPHRMVAMLFKEDREEYDRAITHYELALEKSPPDKVRQEMIEELGQTYLIKQDFEKAREILLTGRETANTLASLADCEMNLGNPEKSREFIDKVLELNPSHQGALSLSGRLYLNQGKFKEAEGHLSRALEIDAHDFPSRHQLAQVYRRLGDQKRANQEQELARKSEKLRQELTDTYRKVMSRPENVELKKRLIELSRELGRPELVKIWERSLQSAEVLQNLLKSHQAQQEEEPVKESDG